MSSAIFMRLREALEAAVIAAGLGQFVQLALGVLDLGLGREIHRRVIGDGHHLLADPDQVAPQRQVVDGTPVILGVDDGGCFGGETGEVLADRHAENVGIGRKEGLQRHRRGNLAHPDQAAGGLVNPLMDGLEEVFRFQEVRDPVEGVVIDEDRTQEALFGLDIVRCAPIGGSVGVGREF